MRAFRISPGKSASHLIRDLRERQDPRVRKPQDDLHRAGCLWLVPYRLLAGSHSGSRYFEDLQSTDYLLPEGPVRTLWKAKMHRVGVCTDQNIAHEASTTRPERAAGH
jgi:hypothetical protein